MSYTITKACIGCQRCLPACPTDAIATDGSTFWIDSDRCNRCQGSYQVPQCWAVCPTNEGCIPLPLASENSDYWESWFATYNQMLARLQAQPSPYWRQWFETYSQMVRRLQTQ